MIRTYAGTEFWGEVMLNWAHSKTVQLFPIELGKFWRLLKAKCAGTPKV